MSLPTLELVLSTRGEGRAEPHVGEEQQGRGRRPGATIVRHLRLRLAATRLSWITM